MRDSTDKALEAQFRAMLTENLGRLRRIARSYAAAGEHEDLLQDMLMQLWRSLPGFDGRSSLSTWVYRVALNTALGTVRRRYAKPSELSMPPEQLLPLTAHSEGDLGDADAILDHFLALLAPLDRAVLMLSLDDLSYADIARITGLSINAVGIRLNRMKQRFEQTYVENGA